MPKKKVIQIRNPLTTIQQGKHCWLNIWGLEAGERLNTSESKEKPNWIKGPAFVIEEVRGLERKFTAYQFGDRKPWVLLGGMLQAGEWALTTEKIAAMLPKELVKISPRFQNTTQRQRDFISQKKIGKQRTPPVKK